jgi:hypothetical protein
VIQKQKEQFQKLFEKNLQVVVEHMNFWKKDECSHKSAVRFQKCSLIITLSALGGQRKEVIISFAEDV